MCVTGYLHMKKVIAYLRNYNKKTADYDWKMERN